MLVHGTDLSSHLIQHQRSVGTSVAKKDEGGAASFMADADEGKAEDVLPAPLVVTELMVAGMCCQSEVALIRKKIGALDGVIDLKFNLMLRRCTVTHLEQVAVVQLQ